MRRAVLFNGALVALALGTLGVVWATRDTDTTADLAARQGKLLQSWHEHDVTQIRLERDGQVLELVRDDGGEFRIQKPWRERADVATVKALLGSLELASALRPADGVSRESAGLGAKSLKIGLKQGQKSQTLTLGGAAPAPSGARYLEAVDADGKSRVYTISQGLVSELDLRWDRFRETRLLNVSRSDIRELQIVHHRSATTITLVPKHSTFVEARTNELVDAEAIERFLTGLTRLVTEQFVELNLAKQALHEAGTQNVQLKVTSGGREERKWLQLGSSCPATPDMALAIVEERAGCIPREVFDALQLTRAILELDRPFSARLDEVEELVLRAGDQKLELARKDRGFVLKLPTRSEVPLEAGNQRIGRILRAKGERQKEPNLAALGLAPAAGEAAISVAGIDAQQGRREVVQIGRARPDGSVCMKRDTDGVVLCLRAEDAQAFAPDATLLKSLELMSFGPAQLASFSVKTAELEERVRRLDDGSYALDQPSGLRHDGALIADAVQSLGSLRAERWVAAHREPAHGLDAPRLRVSIEPAGLPRRELVVGAASEGGYFASLSPDPGVFVLARSLVRELERPLVDRSLCRVPRGELERIDLARGERQLVITRRGDGWEAAGNARAGELGETLSALRADFAVHLGAARPNEGLSKPSLRIRFVDAKGTTRHLLVGARATVDDSSIAYARLDGVDATFALSSNVVDALQDF